MAPIDLHRIQVFCSVVEHKGYAPAARVLGIDERRLGRDMIMLDKSLGTKLIRRDTRYQGLTGQGKVYYAHAAPLMARLQAAIEDIRAMPGDGLLPADAGEAAKQPL